VVKKNTLRTRLMKEYEKVSKVATREPRNGKEVATRLRWERLYKIMIRRYT
jgi:Zn-dependent membrane protease YugP